MTERKRTAAGTAPLNIVTRHTPEDRYLCGALWTRAGWYWWFEAIAPTGEQLCGVVKGPFPSEQAALDDANAKVAAHA